MVSTETTAESTSKAPAWDDALLRNPHTVADKRGRVQRMFAAIAPSYDLNNRLHSLWMDQRWRRKAVARSCLKAGERVVDVACGTGDLTLCFAHALMQLGELRYLQVLGVDFTFEMLPIAREKAASEPYWSAEQYEAIRKQVEAEGETLDDVDFCDLDSIVPFVNGDAQALPLPDASADVVSIAFGIRNVADPAAAIREFYRVLRPGGRLIILEFSLPTNALLRGLYNFYFRKVLPHTATLISGDKTGAYKYLPESVNTFIGRDQMMRMMREARFQNVEQFPLTFGVCVCYRGVKP